VDITSNFLAKLGCSKEIRNNVSIGDSLGTLADSMEDIKRSLQVFIDV